MIILSLFDGLSGGQLALERAGIPVTHYFASEVDKYAMKVASANFPDMTQLGDVCGVTADMLPNIDLLIGGSPCQGFSFAGKQLNFDDPRSQLFFEFVRLLKETKPKYFMLENVMMKQEYQDVISNLLGVQPIKINSALVSAQNRKRLYWTNIPNVSQPTDRNIVLKDIIQLDAADKYIHTPKAIAYMDRAVKGGRNHWDFAHHSDTANDKSACVTANMHKGVPYNVLCARVVGRRLNPVTGKRDDYNMNVKPVQRIEPRLDEKSGCLTTVEKDNILVCKAYSRKTGITKEVDKAYCLNASDYRGLNRNQTQTAVSNGVTFRRLTPVECERLQTIPDNYTNHVSDTQRYKMIGNGWTIDVIAHIFRGLKL